MGELKSGGQIIWESLIHEGVDVVFGLPGGAILPTYDDLYKYDYPVHHVLVTHEQGAAHMADGYARATGKTGVCIATSGPGATNLVTGLATAYMDSTPIVAITGQVPRTLLGRDGFQEADIRAISMPITKHNYLITDIQELPAALKEAFYIARTGRPGPVLVDVCKCVQQATMEFTYPSDVYLPGYRPYKLAPDPQVIKRVARLINEAQRPVIVAGQGVSMARAETELKQLAEKANIPVATSLLGIGTLSATHPLSISWGGMHGEAYCNYALQECDVLFAIGARLDDRLTGAFSTFAPKARIIHVDLDPAEMGKNLTIDTPVVADALMTLRDLLPLVEPNEHPAWLAQINEWRGESVERDILTQETDELIAPYIMRQLWHATNQGNATVVTDVGQHQMWEAQYFNHTKPRSLLTSGGLGTMGYSLPAAIGAQMGKPEEEIWVVAGDGGFQMTMPELSTVMQERLPIKIAIINNGYLGMVRQWQDVFYNKRYVGTPLYNPDFVKVAEAYGIPGRAVTQKEDVFDAIRQAQNTPGPFLLDFQVEEFTNVYPMVAPGKSNADMIRRGLPADNLGSHTMPDTQIQRHTIIAWLEDKPSVLNRVTGLFSRRNFNIESLNVGHSETHGISRMTFVARGTERDLQQVTTQLDKLINVVHIANVTNEPAVVREMALIKVTATGQTRGEIMQLIDIYRASVVNVDMTSLIIQIVAPEDRVNSLIKLLENFGIEEMVRTGRVAMVRGSSPHGHSHGAREWTDVEPVMAEKNGHREY